MRKTNMSAASILPWVAGLSFACGCGANFPVLGAPPQLLSASAGPPVAPTPKMQDLKEVLTFAMKPEVVFVRPVPNFKEHSLGLGAIEGASPAASEAGTMSPLVGLASLLTKGVFGGNGLPAVTGTTAPRGNEEIMLSGKLADLLIAKFMKRGVSKLADLTAVGKGVTVTIEQERNASAAGGKGSVRWAGMLDKMVFVGKVSDADYILYGEIASAGTEVRPVVLGFSYNKADLDRYNAIYIPWRRQTEDRLAANQRALNAYTRQFAQVRDVYVKDGGKFPPPADEADKPAAVHLAEFQKFAKSATELVAADKQALAATPEPNALVGDASARKQTIEVKVASLNMVVKLIDANTKEIVWMQSLSKSDETMGACYDAVLDKIVTDLLAATP
jgi:hypothetical protein